MFTKILNLMKRNYIFYAKYVIASLALSFLISYCADTSYSFSFVYFVLAICCAFLLKKANGMVPYWKAVLWGMLFFLLRAPIVWALNVFPLDDYRLVILTLQMPLNGFVLPFVWDFFCNVFLIGLLLSFLAIPIFKACVSKFSKKGTIFLFFVISLWNLFSLYEKLPVQEYWDFIINGAPDLVLHESDFWKKNFVDADSVKIKAPLKKNLILIIMESMENWSNDLTPEIEQMAAKNISFYSIDSFGGGVDIAGSKNTYCSTVAKTTGLPLLRKNRRLGPDLIRSKSIYDILHRFEYKNVFIQGTDANFAGTKDFTLSHGIDNLYDMNNLKDKWDMDSFFRNFRSFSAGITDQRLYDISKEILDTLSKSLFSLTITTIETHYPYGFYDKNCLEKPESSSEESKFKATLQCASREVYEFVEWIKKQSFFENTQIVIVGDHLFMGHFFEKNRDRRWVDIFINSAVHPKTLNRQFTSIDIAPTILEGMGFQIEGRKMGLGTSLFSDSLTLLEKIGWTRLNSEIMDLSSSIEYNQLHWDKNK